MTGILEKRTCLPSVRVFKTRFHAGTYEDLLAVIEDTLARGGLMAIDTSNTMVASLAAVDGRYREALENFDLRVPDGMPLVWYMRLLGAPLSDTCYAPETLQRVWRVCFGRKRIMVIGADPVTRDLFIAKHGEPAAWNTEILDPANAAQMDELGRQVRVVDPDVLFIGLSCPKSYYLFEALRPRMERGVVIHVGGSFDLVSGRKRITPKLLQRLGLGWLFRLLMEPRRLFTRYLKYNSLFLFHALTCFVGDRRAGLMPADRTVHPGRGAD